MSERKDFQPCCKPRTCKPVAPIKPGKHWCGEMPDTDWRELHKWNGAKKRETDRS